MRYVLIPALLFSLSACTTIQVQKAPSVEPTIGTDPSIGSTSTATVGSAVLSQYKVWKKSGMQLAEPYSGRIGGAPVDVSQTDYLVKAVADSKEAYCTERMTMRNLLGVAIKPTCFSGLTADGHVTEVMVPADSVWWHKDLPRPIAIRAVEESILRPEAFRNELVFLGSAGKTLRLLYREYAGDFVRPAFSQDVAYDVEALPMEIQFRTARIQVLELPGSSIKYRVLSSF
ncbi:hypothetical protein [Comamonas sp. B21-038]|uniref:hypothetical protein n=1 Tax=Comamonas sp. B21-038 TaxID=2918299 RepID=UPI001EFC0548|nr:hypothetical protein [Comamonas sp. B21-038]ULR87332.1 hypothetical protein MJ205_12715 [Comamonas sp. B21-038]